MLCSKCIYYNFCDNARNHKAIFNEPMTFCKDIIYDVGTIVYFYDEVTKNITKGTISMLTKKADGTWKYGVTHNLYFTSHSLDQCFLTEAAAKEAIKEL